MFSHFKRLQGQHNTVSQATCCHRDMGWAGLIKMSFKTQWFVSCFYEALGKARWRDVVNTLNTLTMEFRAAVIKMKLGILPGERTPCVTPCIKCLPVYKNIRCNVTHGFILLDESLQLLREQQWNNKLRCENLHKRVLNNNKMRKKTCNRHILVSAEP